MNIYIINNIKIWDHEAILSSTREFIYSFREHVNSTFPDYTSKEAIEALNKIKEIKNEISSGMN